MARTTARRAQQEYTGPTHFDVPYRFRPLPHQLPLLSAMMPLQDTHRPRLLNGVCVWHRGAGKDLTSLAGVIIPNMLVRPGLYFHVFPKFNQGKRAIWDAIDEAGIPFLSRFPEGLVASKNETELQIVLKPVNGHESGSIYQIVGGDQVDNLVGVNPMGCVYSEWPLMSQAAHDLLAPRLVKSGGWQLFIYTPRGKNHGWDTYQTALANPRKWFSSRLTIEDTHMVSLDKIEDERRNGRPEEIIQQEYYCSFDGYLHGTIYGDCLVQARKDGRIGRIPREANFPVGVCLDIGRSDGTALWFYQTLAREIRLIDYLAFRANKIRDMSAAQYAIKRILEKPYTITRVILPNDANITGYSANKSTYEVFCEAFRDVILLDKIPVQQGIDMGRNLFSRLVIDEDKCGMPQEDNLPSGLDSLGNYRREWDDKKQEYRQEPVHDEYSHGADGFRYGAMEGFTPLEWQTYDEVSGAGAFAETEFAVFGGRR
ncbi:MAG: hypothetical protein ABFD60_07880 [Bryobacteraceae bacterium]